jgi:hypothetical protein
MVADAIRDCSHRKGIVLDAFVGSGTTLIAAEKTGRRGYGIEIDPAYCDVTIRRMRAVCGLEAVLEPTVNAPPKRKSRQMACQVATRHEIGRRLQGSVSELRRLLTGLLYSLGQAAVSTDHRGWGPPPSGREFKARTATRGQPVALLIYAFHSQGTLAAYCRFLRAIGVEVEKSVAGQAWGFRPPNNARLFRVTLAPATLPVRREVVCTDLRQTGPRLEP